MTKKFGPFTECATVEGTPIVINGQQDPAAVHLDDGGEPQVCLMSRDMAREIANHLFTSIVRVRGMARRVRHCNGTWETTRFDASGFTVLRTATLEQEVERLRAVHAEWKNLEDPLAALEEIRHG
jgi:hypothetical protein